MTTITYAGGPAMTPDSALVETGAIRSTSGTVSHDILDGDPVHTLRPAGPRTGSLHLKYSDERAAFDCFTAHGIPAIFTVADPDHALLNFRYVTSGDRELNLDDRTQAAWVVVVPYQVVG